MEETYEKNSDLIRRAQEGSREAMDEIVRLNMGLVKSTALRFRDRGTEYEDLVQIGTIGMIKAVKSFRFEFHTVFSTYAVPLIIGEIRRYLRDDGMIKVGRGIKKQGISVMREKERFVRENGREPRVSELAQRCGLSMEEMVYALEAVSPVHSLNERQGDDDALTLESTIADKKDEIAAMTDRIALAEAIRSLPELQRKIVILRYFREMSQQQTGEILGLTQVKVSREEKKIMEQLRQAL